MELNKSQQVAVDHLDGPCLVTAAPGSGKTRIIVERTISLIEKGIDPQNILCITFTNKAAKEMRNRICNRLGIKRNDFFIGTFHSLCVKILKKLGKYIGYNSNFLILDENDQKDLVFQISKNVGYIIDRKEAALIAWVVNNCRDRLESEEYLEEKLQNKYNYIRIATEYLSYIKENNMIDFSGLIYETIKLLIENEEVKKNIQEKFKYLQIDEGQDTNFSQFKLINLFAEKWKNIFIVADINQSIYSFRGARYQNMLDFLKMYPNCINIILAKNYRSTPQIIKVACNLIKYNKCNITKFFDTDNSNGDFPSHYFCYDQIDEAEWIYKKVKYFIEEEGWDLEDIAILYRINSMSESLERIFAKYGISYEVIGSRSFYDRKEIRDCLAMLKFYINKNDKISFYRICSLIKGMGGTTIAKIEKKAEEKNIDLLKAINKIDIKNIRIKNACEQINEIFNIDFKNAGQCLLYFIEKLNYKKYLMSHFDEKSYQNRLENINQFIDSSGNAMEEFKDIESYLQSISLITSNDKETEKGKISLLTLHSAKGLEFSIVFIIGVEKDILPHDLAIQEDKENIEEERRLAYVGMTRAKKKLFLSSCTKRRKFGKKGIFYKNVFPSQFLYECGLLEI